MRATQVVAPGKIEYLEAPQPPLKPGYVLVRPVLLSLCGSDIHTLCHLRPEEYPCGVGSTGHEMVGVIEAADAPGYDFHPGQVALVLPADQLMMAEHYLAPADVLDSLPAAPWSTSSWRNSSAPSSSPVSACPTSWAKLSPSSGKAPPASSSTPCAGALGAERVIGLDLVEGRGGGRGPVRRHPCRQQRPRRCACRPSSGLPAASWPIW